MSHHACASLPMTTVSFHAWYCGHHQAWACSVWIFHEDGGDDVQPLSSDSIEFGPFDSTADVTDWITSRVVGGVNSVAP